jgi:hypothetical protein
MQIDFSEEQYENALSSISVRCDPDSNVNVDSAKQWEKQSFPKTSTDAGIQMERKELQQ